MINKSKLAVIAALAAITLRIAGVRPIHSWICR